MNSRVRAVNNRSNKFYEKYHKEIAPLLLEYEQKRVDEILKLIAYEIFCISVLLLCVWGYWRLFDIVDSSCLFWPLMMLGLGAIAVVGVFIYLPFKVNSDFIKTIKNNCMDKIISVFGDINWLDKEAIITDSVLNKSDLFASYNRRVHKDGFKGDYKGVKYSIAETEMYYETGSGKNRTVWPVFNGVIMKFSSNKKINNKTIITSKKDINIKKRPWGAIMAVLLLIVQMVLQFESKGVKNYWLIILIIILILVGFGLWSSWSKAKNQQEEVLNEVKLEDPVFSKKYDVYSSDQIEARYLVTTAFMERFNNIRTAFGAKNIKCSFCDDDIIFAVWTNKNLFEIGNLFKRLDNPSQMSEFFNELASILDLVDYFKLDEHTKL